jgi:hypothetical protein
MARRFRIHPGIGTARVGNAQDTFFWAPAKPGIPALFDIPSEGWGRSRHPGRTRAPAGARVLVFEFDEIDGRMHDAAGYNGRVQRRFAVNARPDHVVDVGDGDVRLLLMRDRELIGRVMTSDAAAAHPAAPRLSPPTATPSTSRPKNAGERHVMSGSDGASIACEWIRSTRRRNVGRVTKRVKRLTDA